MSYQPNPFDEHDMNPFAHAGSVPRETKLDPLPHEPPSDRAFNISHGNGNDREQELNRRERYLEAKEAELNRREQELKKKEEAAARAGVFLDKRNWPPFFPIIHNDIAGEIPDYLQPIQYKAFACWLGIAFCLLWNVIAICALWFGSVGGGAELFLLACIYLLIGVPGSYVLWYMPLYKAMRKESAFRFGCFFLFFLLHIAFVIYAAVAPPFLLNGWSFTGVLAAIDLLTINTIIGIFFIIGASCFCLEALLSLWVLQQVLSYFRGTGKAAERKRQAARGTMLAALS